MLDEKSGYEALRNSAGAYRRGATIYSVTGTERGAFVSFICAKRTEFAQPGTVVESIALDDDGGVLALIVVVVEDERILLVSDRAFVLDVERVLADRPLDDVDIVEVTAGFSAAAVEGPLSWKAIQILIEDEVSSVLLNEFRSARFPRSEASGLVARVGTTAEYGYLLLIEAPREDLDALAVATELAASVGGGLAPESSLRRAQAEVSHPIVPEQFEGLSLAEAGALWTLSSDREDDFRGRVVLDSDHPSRRVIAIRSTQGMPPTGTLVHAGDVEIGHVQIALAQAGQAHGFGLAVLDAPFDVPGLTVRAGGIEIETVSRPAAALISWVEPIGS